MSNNKPENDLVWLNNVSVHEEIDFGGNGHKTEEEYHDFERKDNIEHAVRTIFLVDMMSTLRNWLMVPCLMLLMMK